MRLLVISQYFWPEDFRLNDIVKGMIERGHDVTILTSMPNYPKGVLADGYTWAGPYTDDFHGARVVRVPQITRGNSKGLRLVLNYLSFVITACLLGPLRCTGKFDTIFVFQPSPVTVGIPARLMSWIKKAPIIFWVQDLWPESLSATGTVRNERILSMVGSLVRWTYRGCDLVLGQSKAFFQSLRDMGVPDEKMDYFPNSAEKLYRPVSRDEPWTGPELPDGFKVMFAGNLGVAQSLDTIVAAANLLKSEPNIHWIIVGDGRQRAWMEAEVEKHNLQHCVHLMGRHAMDTMPNWFAQADVMLASLSKEPIFALTIPAKIQSYLACAKPIIAAMDGEGARVVEEAKAGFGVPSQDAEGLANRVLEMSRLSSDQLREMGENGLRHFNENFERELLLDRLELMLSETVETRS